MAKNSPKTTDGSTEVDAKPRSVEYAEKGIRTSEDFANLMSTMMSDILQGQVKPDVANATINAGGKLLKIVEMQYKYGTPETEKAHPSLRLSSIQ